MTNPSHNNDATLKIAIVQIIYGFIKSHCSKVVIVTIIRPNKNIRLHNFEELSSLEFECL